MSTVDNPDTFNKNLPESPSHLQIFLTLAWVSKLKDAEVSLTYYIFSCFRSNNHNILVIQFCNSQSYSLKKKISRKDHWKAMLNLFHPVSCINYFVDTAVSSLPSSKSPKGSTKLNLPTANIVTQNHSPLSLVHWHRKNPLPKWSSMT